MSRRCVPWLLATVLLAGCSTTNDDVRAVEAEPIGTSATSPERTAPDSPGPETPPEAEPHGSEPPATRPARPGGATPETVPAAGGTVDDCSPDELVPTDTGAGDELFPAAGNPGIDAEHYDVNLVVGADGRIGGTVGIDLRFTEDRDTFSLDADGPVVDRVTVDETQADFSQSAGELVITPPRPARSGDEVRVEIAYAASPREAQGADGVPYGWFNTPGGSYVFNEPDGARQWLPSNDHPSDKATFRFTVKAAPGRTAVANGELVGHEGDTWVWEEDRPMATYLIQLLTGDYEVIDGVGPRGLPLTHAVLRADVARMQPLLDGVADQITFFEQYFGPYPLDRYGLAITDSFPGLAMETQERSMFSNADLTGTGSASDELLTSHELGHQWFGDAVTLGRWTDIWLNESFATYAQWMWFEHEGLSTVDEQAMQALRMRQGRATADPTAGDLFGFNSYDGGAVVLQALRRTIGDDTFFEVLRRWVDDHEGDSCTTGGFIAVAESVSGQDLGPLFDDWLFAVEVPTAFPPVKSR